uniref:C2HC zinc finger plants domain-containing protein n=1 Tax=Rhizophora mucronata TaxID=61149 RepID=A0A2P2JUG5_RHIMU
MDHNDAEMTEREAVAAAPHQQDRNDAARELLVFARLLINQGKPSQALQAVVMAMRTQGGDEAVFQSLHCARELYRNRLQANIAVDQLASLFAECAIAEAQPLTSDPTPATIDSSSVVTDINGRSILAETGRMQIVLDAFSDGSSFICLQCGGLVSNLRKDEHYTYWCSRP